MARSRAALLACLALLLAAAVPAAEAAPRVSTAASAGRTFAAAARAVDKGGSLTVTGRAPPWTECCCLVCLAGAPHICRLASVSSCLR